MNHQLIVTSIKPYGVIKGALKKWKKIGVVACNACARHCETGGKKRMEELAERLKNDGYEVVDTDLVPMVCNLRPGRSEYNGDTIIVLACDAGVFTLQSLFPTKIIVPATNTLGIGARDGVEGSLFIMKKF